MHEWVRRILLTLLKAGLLREWTVLHVGCGVSLFSQLKQGEKPANVVTVVGAPLSTTVPVA